MNPFRLSIVIALFLIIVLTLWRFQKVKAVRLGTRIILLPGAVAVVLLGVISATVINRASGGRMYDAADRVPIRDAALVLGANRKAAPAFFENRIDAAAALFTAGRVHAIVVSGSSKPGGADEASDMRTALVAHGIPASSIRMDPKGTNTYASIRNFKEQYPSQSVTLVSQRYHVARGIYMASRMGMEPIGFSLGRIGTITSPREFLARIKAVFFTHYE